MHGAMIKIKIKKNLHWSASYFTHAVIASMGELAVPTHPR
jgi:hypothetical protein